MQDPIRQAPEKLGARCLSFGQVSWSVQGRPGTLNGFKARIYVDPDTPPLFNPTRSVPFSLRKKVDKELERLQTQGTKEPVEFAEWATPMVTVLKQDKNIVRTCRDFNITVTPVSKLDRYPIPKVEDLFARLFKGKHFTKLDLNQA